MSSVDTPGNSLRSPTEQLLESSWEDRERKRASQREVIVEAAAAALFVAVAALLIVISHPWASRPEVAGLLVGIYVVVARIEFPIGTGHVVPTQLVLIPMLLWLPPAMVPVAVALGLTGAASVDWAMRRVPARRVLSAVPDAWHAVGPALVLILAGAPHIDFEDLPLLGVAFVAGCLVDLASSLIRLRLMGAAVDFRLQIRVIARVWAVDASLAPLGFLAAIATRQGYAAILFVLPLVFLLWMLAQDRSARIEQAHQRLKLVEKERVRLQAAVRRLGDAFAAKLELAGLMEILLHGSIESLDADAGRIQLRHCAEPVDVILGSERSGELISRREPAAEDLSDPYQVCEGDHWLLTLPLRIASVPEVLGSLSVVRAGRAFEEDEISLISELASKAEQSGAEILTHHEIREQAVTDALTGLGNRRKLSVDLAGSLTEAGSDGRPSLLLLFDLDGFKDYNDTFGHLAGDALLARLGGKLQRAVAGFGAAYRLGGDEFCAHLDLDGQDSETLILRAAAALQESGVEFSIRASLGVVLLPHEADSADHALQLADERMYANKRGRATGARSQAGEVLLRTMHAKQPDLDEHSSNVALLAGRVARRLGVTGEALDEIARAAELHDIGKVGIPDAILNKPSALNEIEWEFIYQHTILGERILHGAPALRPVARLVRASHERWDGTGYPDRLQGDDIPLGARIVSVCDAYEAMTADRSYRAAIGHDAACEELQRSSGSQFDPMVIQAFLEVIESEDIEHELDAGQMAAAHVRSLLASNPLAH